MAKSANAASAWQPMAAARENKIGEMTRNGAFSNGNQWRMAAAWRRNKREENGRAKTQRIIGAAYQPA